MPSSRSARVSECGALVAVPSSRIVVLFAAWQREGSRSPEGGTIQNSVLLVGSVEPTPTKVAGAQCATSSMSHSETEGTEPFADFWAKRAPDARSFPHVGSVACPHDSVSLWRSSTSLEPSATNRAAFGCPRDFARRRRAWTRVGPDDRRKGRATIRPSAPSVKAARYPHPRAAFQDAGRISESPQDERELPVTGRSVARCSTAPRCLPSGFGIRRMSHLSGVIAAVGRTFE